MSGRSLRPRSACQYVNQQEWDMDEDEFIMARRYNVLERFSEYETRGDQGMVREMRGEDFTLKWIQEHGLTSPIVFRDASGLGIKVPPQSFSVADVKRLIGPRREVDVMDTHTQKAVNMTMQQWTKYYQTFPRKKILNVISLEFSCTEMADLVEPPTVVRELDWVERVWPREMKDAQSDPTNDMRRMMYPKVQKYCLMSVANCYTDFHLDFGGTSVWYHLIRGEKLFLLIPPSPSTYDMFHLWQLSGEQEGVFFADLIERAQFVRLSAGDTFIMPSGWIHSVYTPSDSLVFGGNFLHSFNIRQQLAVAEMEARTKVPSKFRYPFYGNIHWYTLVKYSEELMRAGVKPRRDRKSNETECERVGARWLKEICVERVSVSSGESSLSTSPSHTSDGSSSPTTPHHAHGAPSQPTSMTHKSPPSPSQNTPSLPQQSTPKSSPKPFISSIEIDGLLELLKKMQEEELFLTESPPSLADPLVLTAQLVSQLKSSRVQKLLPTKPTGVSLLQKQSQKSPSKLPNRKRKGLELKTATPEKYSRADKICNVSESPVDCSTSVKPEDCDRTLVELEDCELAFRSDNCTSADSVKAVNCGAEYVAVKPQRNSELHTNLLQRITSKSRSPEQIPVTHIQSPLQNSFDLIDPPLDESEDLSQPHSPSYSSPFTLCLPCSPSLTTPHPPLQ